MDVVLAVDSAGTLTAKWFRTCVKGCMTEKCELFKFGLSLSK